MSFDLGQRHVLLQLDRQRLACGSASRRCARTGRSTGIGVVPAGSRGRGSCWSRRRPSILPSTGRRRRSLSIQGIRLPPSGTPNCFGLVGDSAVLASPAPCGRSRGSPTPGRPAARLHLGVERAELASAARACAGRRRPMRPGRSCDVIHSTRSALNSAPTPISMQLTRCSCRRCSCLHAARQRVLDDVQVDRVEDDDRVVLHAQRRGGVDPVAVPAGGAQLAGTLRWCSRRPGGDDDVAAASAPRCRSASCSVVSFFAMRRRVAAGLRGGEEHRLDEREVAFGLHALACSTEPTMPRQPTRPTSDVAIDLRPVDVLQCACPGPAPRPGRARRTGAR